MEMIKLKCAFCGKEFETPLTIYKEKKHKLQKNFYCGKQCSFSHQSKLRQKGLQKSFRDS